MNQIELTAILEQQRKDGTLSLEGSEYLDALKKQESGFIKNYVDSVHKGKIRTKQKKKNGKTTEYFWTEVLTRNGTYKEFSARTEDGLYRKLYCYYEDVPAESKMSLASIFKKYYIDRCNDASISSQTAHYDLSTWNRFFKDKSLASMDIRCIKSSHILRYFKREVCKNGEITQKAFMKAHTLLNMIFDYAMIMDIVSANPSRTRFPGLKFAEPKDNSQEVYTREERDQLLSYLRNLPQQTVYSLSVQLAACLCLRLGELRALTWDDYDEDNGKLLIWHQIVKVEKDGYKRSDIDVPYTKSHSKKGRRWVPVSTEAAKVLKQLRDLNGDRHYIIQSKGSMSITEQNFNEKLKQFCREAGVPYYSSHKFRFYGITALYDAGAEEETIRQIAGHTTVDMTRHYRRSGDRELPKSVLEAVFN